MEEGFVGACSNNIPLVDSVMVGMFFTSNADFISSEQRGVKLSRSSREHYGDSAVGYVQVKREGGLCTVQGKVTPEHRVRKLPYIVRAVINEIDQVDISVQCLSCAASAGGCKHGVAFLMWLHRRSEEPSPTEVVSYWKKSKLSSVGTSIKFITVEEITGAAPLELLDEPGSFRNKILEECIDRDVQNMLTSTFGPVEILKQISIHQMMITFIKERRGSAHEFVTYAEGLMTDILCQEAYEATLKQSDSPLWHELRFGRITASKVYEVSRCRTVEGALVEQILGAQKFKSTEAMKRGLRLEQDVLKKVGNTFSKNIERCGIRLCPSLPIFAASPDGIMEDILIEIKCPTEGNINKYIINNFPAARYMAQMQLQMLIMNKKKCLFVVADPQFEKNLNFQILDVEFDETYAKDLITASRNFWEKNIFSMILTSYQFY